jgi:hypothetical protein
MKRLPPAPALGVGGGAALADVERSVYSRPAAIAQVAESSYVSALTRRPHIRHRTARLWPGLAQERAE